MTENTKDLLNEEGTKLPESALEGVTGGRLVSHNDDVAGLAHTISQKKAEEDADKIKTDSNKHGMIL